MMLSIECLVGRVCVEGRGGGALWAKGCLNDA